MANRLNLNLDAWKAKFTAEPAALGTAAAPIVQSNAQAAAAAVKAAYPTGPTGNLKAGVRVVTEPTDDPAVVASRVVSSAPHAHLIEDGTRYIAPRPIFFPITNEYGDRAKRELDAMVETRGYQVSGSAE